LFPHGPHGRRFGRSLAEISASIRIPPVLLGDDIRLTLLLLLNAGVLVPAWLATRRWTTDGVQRIADALLIWFAVQYAAVCGPGLLHVLSPVTMAVTALAMGGGLLWFALRPGTGSSRDGKAKSFGRPQDDNTSAKGFANRTSRHCVFFAAAVFVIGIIGGVIYKQNMLPVVDSDAMTYHVPAAVSWLRTGKLGLFPVWFFNPANTFSPLAGSAFIAWLLGPLNDPVLARAVQAPALLLLFLATLQIGRTVGLPPIVAALLAVGCAVSRPFSSEVMSARDDVFLAAFVTVAIAGCGGEAAADRFAPWRIGIAVGLAAATKYTFVFAAPLLLLVIDAPVRAGWTARRWAIAVTCALVIAGPWYLRNLLLTGNPVYPVEITVLGRRVLPGSLRALPSERLRSVAGLRAVLVRGFHAPPVPLLVLLVLGWLGGVIVAARDAVRQPLVRVCLVGPPVCLALFIAKAPYGEVRFLFPSLAVVFVAAGLAVCRWRRVAPTVGVALAAIVAGVSLFTSYVATWLVAEIAVPAALITAAAVALAWADERLRRNPRLRAYAAGVAALALAVPVYVYWPSYVRHCREIQPVFWARPEEYPRLAGGWKFVAENVPPDAAIAYTNAYLVYPLQGVPPVRPVLYVPVRADVADFLHLPRFPEPVSGEHIEETFSRLLCEHPDRETWLRRLLASGAAYLYVGRSTPVGDPPEMGFAADDPAHFTRVFADEGSAIFRVEGR
jgi:hypothetical protein